MRWLALTAVLASFAFAAPATASKPRLTRQQAITAIQATTEEGQHPRILWCQREDHLAIICGVVVSHVQSGFFIEGHPIYWAHYEYQVQASLWRGRVHTAALYDY